MLYADAVAVLGPGRRGGHNPPVLLQPLPPLSFVATHVFFAKLTHIFDFAFPNFRKAGIFVASIKRSKIKSASASAGLRPTDPLTRGFAPEPRWELCPQTPVIGSRYRAHYHADG